MVGVKRRVSGGRWRVEGGWWKVAGVGCQSDPVKALRWLSTRHS